MAKNLQRACTFQGLNSILDPLATSGSLSHLNKRKMKGPKEGLQGASMAACRVRPFLEICPTSHVGNTSTAHLAAYILFSSSPSFVCANARMIYLPCGQFSLPRGGSTLETSHLDGSHTIWVSSVSSTPSGVAEAATTVLRSPCSKPAHQAIFRMGLKAHVKADRSKGGNKLLPFLRALC